MSGILVEVYEQGGTLLETHPVLDSYVVEVPVAQTVGVIEVGILGPQGPAGPEGPAGPGGGGDVYKAADQTFTGVNTFTGISVLQGPIQPVIASDVAVRVRGLVGQSGDLQRWEDSSGAPVVQVTSSGGLFVGPNAPGRVYVSPSGIDLSFGFDTGGGTLYMKGGGISGVSQYIVGTMVVANSGIDFLSGDASGKAAAGVKNLDLKGGRLGIYGGAGGFGTIALQAPSAGDVVAQLRGYVGQAADLQQWQDSSGTPLAYVSPTGDFIADAVGARSSTDSTAFLGTARVEVLTGVTTAIGVLIRGAASQSADLLQALASDGTTVLAKVTKDGYIYEGANRVYSAANPPPGGSGGGSPFVAASDASTPLVVRAFSPTQSGNLQEWQNSAGTAYARMDSVGSLTLNQIAVGGSAGGQATLGSVHLAAIAGSASLIPIVARGATSQSASLQEWQNDSGGVAAKVRNDGLIGAPFFTNTGDSGPYLQMGSSQISVVGRGQATGSPLLQVTNNRIDSVPLAVVAVSGQTVNLQEWQRSDATKVAYIDQNGSFGALSTLNPFFVAQSAGAGDITWLGQVTNAGTWFSDTAANDGLIGHQGSGALRLGVGATIGGTLPAQVSITSTAVTSAVPLYATALYDNGSHVAIDSAVVHNTGSETVAGTKNFTAALTVSRPTNNDAIVLFNTTDSTSGRFRPKAGGGFDFVNNAATVAVLQLTDAGALVVASTIASGGNITENGNRVYSAGNAPPYPVTTVAGRTGAVVIAPADVSGVYYSGNANLASATPAAVASAGAVGAGTDYARGNHVHVGVTSVNGTSGVITGLAVDSTVVHNTGAETVAGVKTFSSIPVVPVLAWPVGSINATGTAGAGNYLRGDGTWSIPVTSVTGSTFISFTASTGSVTASLSATGTPGATNVLRGDNTWAAVPMSSQYTAKGTILVGSAASTPSAQAVGTDGQVLVARSAQTNGVGWENTNFAATGLGSTGNTVTETVIASFTIPAAYLLAGTVLRLACLGQASSTQTLTFKVHCGINGTTADALLQTFTTSAAGVANQHAMLDAFVHCLTAGSGGTIYAGGIATYGTAVLPPVTAAAISAAVDTTVQNKITVTMTNGSAGTSFTSRTATLNRVA